MSDVFETTALIPSVSIEGLLASRKAVLDYIAQAIELIEKAEALTTKFGMGSREDWLFNKSDPYRSPVFDKDVLQKTAQEMDRGGWQYLMKESGLITFMDSERRREWSKSLNDGRHEIPSLTLENITATFKGLHDQRLVMFEDGVINCFKRLSWDYKTNRPHMFGKKIIMNNMVSYNPKWGFSNNYSYLSDQLADLERAFCRLDNKLEPDHRVNCVSLFRQVVGPKDVTELDTEYFHLRWYQKRSLHVIFKRPDLVDGLNKILAKRYPDILPSVRF